MACNDPRKVFYVGINPDTGKKKIFYTSRYTDYIWRRNPHDKWHTVRIPESQTATHGTRNIETYRQHLRNIDISTCEIITDFDYVPCGQCIGCRMDIARKWSARIMLETKNYPPNHCWFVTFTYDDDHMPPKKDVIDPVTGEIKKAPFSSVSKREHQLLMKRIRKHYGDGIRFFMSAEYGSKSYRCHYHYILFGLPRPDDLTVYKRNWRGDTYYNSESFTKNVWSDEYGNPRGFVVFGKVELDSASYIARYTIKKRKLVDKEAYVELGLEPEFCLMSRRPGIGKEYFEDNYENIYETDSITIPSFDGYVTTSPPPYYDSLLERIDPDKYKDIKENRKDNRKQHDMLQAHLKPDLDLDDIYETQERALLNQIKFKKDSEL